MCSSKDKKIKNKNKKKTFVELIGVSMVEPDLVEKCLAFWQTLAKKKSVEAFCGHGCFIITQGAFQCFCPVQKKVTKSNEKRRSKEK